MKRVLITSVLSILATLYAISTTAATLTIRASGGNYTLSQFQQALNDAVCGDVLQIQAGQEVVGTFTAPNKGVCSSEILITSDGDPGNLPGAGIRTGPQYVPYMATIRSSGGGVQAMSFANGANGYTFRHIRWPPVPQGFNDIILAGSATLEFTANQPYNLIFDRIYVFGDDVFGQKSGIYLNSGTTSIINSYFEQITGMGQDASCIRAQNGTGPYTITNNYLECGAFSFIIGGSDPSNKTHMTVSANPTTTSADVTVTNAGHTLAELSPGMHIAIEVAATGQGRLRFARIATVTGSGTTGSITWTPAIDTAPSVNMGIRRDNVPYNIQVHNNFMTKDLNWRNGILMAPAAPAGTPQTGTGSLAAGTYYYRLQGFNANGYNGNGVFSDNSAVTGVTLSATGQIVLTYSIPANTQVMRLWRCADATTTACEWRDVPPTTYTDNGAAGWTSATRFAGNRWVVKNNFELKGGELVRVSGNIFQNLWTGNGGDGSSLWLKAVNQDGGCWSCYTEDVIIEKNVIRSTPSWLLISARESYSGNPWPRSMKNVTLRNNLVYDCNSTYGSTGRNVLANASTDLTITHNTLICTQHSALYFGDDVSSGLHQNFVVTYNLMLRNSFGVFSTAGEGTAALSNFTSGYTFTQNVVAAASCGIYPATTLCPTAGSFEAEFVSYIDGLGGDWHLVVGSPWIDAAPGPLDLGADIDLVLAAVGEGVSEPPASTNTPGGWSIWLRRLLKRR